MLKKMTRVIYWWEKCKVRKEDLSTYQVPYKKGVKYAYAVINRFCI